MSAHRSLLGALALWATLCVVLLACRGLSGTQVGAEPGNAPARTSLAWDLSPTATAPDTPLPELPAAEPLSATESGPDPELGHVGLPLRQRRTAWTALAPLWPSDALRRQRLEPSLRLNPGHAPPYA
ncbi:hypothetical protein [Stenotrophomonas sp. JAG2]|uniref:hypothetical protein n=1 Tax=Stenotrophomonas sp. JAG2 TaxID=3229243 RepID=UPI0034E2E17B